MGLEKKIKINELKKESIGAINTLDSLDKPKDTIPTDRIRKIIQ
ncbi:hypothetical protein GGC63_002456 [Paenibacillus sp. OAS669]|nr:hypothetical protein [Paenibacillus sp. OAS669]